MNDRLLCVLIALLTAGRAAACAGAAERDAAPGDRIFAVGQVIKFDLTLSDKQFAALAPTGAAPFGPPGKGPPGKQRDGTHRNTFGVDLPWSHGTLKFAGQSFSDVGVRYKGNYTYMATAKSLKKSLKLDFNRFVPGQKLDGLTLLNLHCGVSDPSRARESLSYAFFRDAGVPAPRTSFAELTLTVPGKYDQELVGVYTLVEQVNKGFLARHFQDGNGMLLKPEGLQGGPTYLGMNWRAYEARYKPEAPPHEDQKKRLIEFTRLISSGSDEGFAQDIGNYLDVDAFLRFIAANALLANLDSYLGYGHNYYLYLVPTTNKFVFIPWDLDLSLATWPAAGMPEQLVELSIHHPHAGQDKLLDRLFAVPAYKSRYLAIIHELTKTCFTRLKLLERLSQIEGALEGPLAREAQAVAARNEARSGGGNGNGPFGGGFGNGQFGQSMPPQRFINKRLAAVAAQLEGRTKGFEPKPVGSGFGGPPGGGFGPPGGAAGPPRRGPTNKAP